MKTKRIILTTLAAVTVVSAAAFSANAADKPNRKDALCESISQQAPNWIWDLIKNPVCNPLPEEKPDTDVPVIPEQKPEETPPQTPPQENVPDSGSVHAYEKEVVALVNAERAKYGLSALTLSENLCNKARIKSQDMADRNYFSHNSPTYGTPFEMMQSFGISYRAAGENIAQGYSTPRAVVTAWMNSEGHRENILSSKYTHIGVGYTADGNHWTQWFIG